MKGIRAWGKEGKSLKPAKTALAGQGGLWVDEDLLVKLLSSRFVDLEGVRERPGG